MSQAQLDVSDEQDFRTVLSTGPGARFVASILAMCKFLESSYHPGITDMHEVAFREGQRAIGLMLWDLAGPDGIHRINKAAQKRTEIYEQADESDEA